jgi:hypothetical protein
MGKFSVRVYFECIGYIIKITIKPFINREREVIKLFGYSRQIVK